MHYSFYPLLLMRHKEKSLSSSGLVGRLQSTVKTVSTNLSAQYKLKHFNDKNMIFQQHSQLPVASSKAQTKQKVQTRTASRLSLVSPPSGSVSHGSDVPLARHSLPCPSSPPLAKMKKDVIPKDEASVKSSVSTHRELKNQNKAKSPDANCRQAQKKSSRPQGRLLFWSEWRDLNPRPLPPQGSTLPAAPHPDDKDNYTTLSPKNQERRRSNPAVRQLFFGEVGFVHAAQRANIIVWLLCQVTFVYIAAYVTYPALCFCHCCFLLL